MTDKASMRQMGRHRWGGRLAARVVAGVALLGLAVWAGPQWSGARTLEGDFEVLREYWVQGETSSGNARVAALAGFTRAEQRLGDAVPTGRRVLMGHVEGDPGQYRPRTNHQRYEGVEWVLRAGESEAFGHADQTARIIYGPGGLAPGVSEVHLYPTGAWIGGLHLRAGSPVGPWQDRPIVYSHSWISNDGEQHGEILRRVDYVIDRHNKIMAVGVNNDRRSRVPDLLASAHNVISVGAGGGASSGGLTRLEGEGRSKPDLIGPRGQTSFTTPVVAAAAARLVEAGLMLGRDEPGATRPETIKAVLMAGALKTTQWSQPPDKPLHDYLGAGVVNFDRALRIMQGQLLEREGTHGGSGWAFDELGIGGSAGYTFEIEDEADAEELSAVLTWHRRMGGTTVPNPEAGRLIWQTSPRTAQFELRLIFITPSGREGEIAASRSEVDNVQHIHITNLPAGRYRLEVVRLDEEHDEDWSYAMAVYWGEREVFED